MRINLSKREKALVFLAFAAVLFFFYHKYYLTPILQEAAAVKKEMHRNQEMLASLKADNSMKDTFAAEIEKLKSSIEELELLVPPSPKTSEIITQIETYSKTAGVVLESMDFRAYMIPTERPDEEKLRDNYLKVPVRIHVSGSYGEIMALLKALEGSERLYNITGFDLSAVSLENGYVLDMGIDLCAYALPIEEQPPRNPEF